MAVLNGGLSLIGVISFLRFVVEGRLIGGAFAQFCPSLMVITDRELTLIFKT